MGEVGTEWPCRPVASGPEPPECQGPRPAATAVCREIRVVNPNGLHMRLAERFVRRARAVRSAVLVKSADKRADGTSILALLGLVALPGTTLVLEVDGPDAPDAIGPLAEILAAPSEEDDPG